MKNHYLTISVAILSTLLLSASSCLAGEHGGSKLDKFVDDLFLGEVVYPQNQGEFQFTTGYLHANKGNDFLLGSKGDDDFEIPLIFEYGLTDYLQLAAVFPIEFLRTGAANTEGVGNVELECYYNFYNDRRSGRAYGVGFALGLPPATTDIGKEAVCYEPFFVAYQQLDSFAINFSAGLEIEDPLSSEEETEVGGDVSLAFMRDYGKYVLLTEMSTEIESDATLVRFSPGLVWKPREGFEVGVALPIGLTEETPDLGVFVLMTIEFGGGE